MPITKLEAELKSGLKAKKAPRKIRVRSARRDYHVHVGAWDGPGLDARLSELGNPRGRQAVIFTETRHLKIARKIARRCKARGFRSSLITGPGGESTKRLSVIQRWYTELGRRGADRSSILLALGGGAWGDAVGFTAATYLRGLDWVAIPTTLIAQVDSSVGGKVAVNHKSGKNRIGAFHPPRAVWCDPRFLATLSERDRVSGWGEVVKTALLSDGLWFTRILRARGEARRPFVGEVLLAHIERCVRAKARVVESDEDESRGLRDVLNFGHTLGHALETATCYRRYRHGEAVILGMRAAIVLSRGLPRGRLAPRVAVEILEFLRSLPTPVVPPSVSDEMLMRGLKYDKKIRRGKLKFVLLKAKGHPVVASEVSRAQIRAAIREMRGLGT